MEGKLNDYIDLVEQNIDLKAAEELQEYYILPSVDEELQEYADEKTKIRDTMQKRWAEVAKDLGVVKEKVLKFESNKQFGYFYRLSKKEEKCLKEKSAYHSFDIRKDGIKFRDSKLENLNQQYSELSEAYSQKQTELVNKLLDTVGKTNTILAFPS